MSEFKLINTECDVQDIRQRIFKKPDLIIQRVPQNTLNQFREFADKEFCSDYGMCLKHLIDFYSGLIPSGLEIAYTEIEELKKKIDIIELKLEKKNEEKETRMRLDGTRI